MSSTHIAKYGNYLSSPFQLFRRPLSARVWLPQPSYPHRALFANQSNRAKWQSELDPPSHLALFSLGHNLTFWCPGNEGTCLFSRRLCFKAQADARAADLWLLLLGPGSLKAGWEAKQSLATLPACPPRWRHWSTLAHTPQPLRARTGAAKLGLLVSGEEESVHLPFQACIVKFMSES